MSAQKSIESKSLAPKGLEDKAVAPVEPEPEAAPAPEPEADARVEVIVAHPVPAGRIGNAKDLVPGDTTKVNKYLARQLVEQGVGRYAN